MARRFIIVGTDFSGLGWVRKLQAEGEEAIYAYEEPDDIDTTQEYEAWSLNGEGVIDKMPIKKAVDTYLSDASTYWVFDSNNVSKVSAMLRKAGRKVLGAAEISVHLEHDRQAAMDMAEESGLGIADVQEFKTAQEGVKYLEAHPDVAYVFKPNDSALHYLTFVPQHEDDEQANTILQAFLLNFRDSLAKGYILQERKKGVEVNFELWLDRGKPVLATCGLESKRILNGDLGEHCGCAQDLIFTVPIDCKGIKDTVGKTLPYYKDYTGTIDVNCILSDREVWFLEVCDRFGYSAHPNLFTTLAMDGFGDLIADLIDGKTAKYADRFRGGFGASVNLGMEHLRSGWPMLIADAAETHYFPYDLYKEGDQFLLSGYSKDVGVVAAHGYTMQDAIESVHTILERKQIWYPDMGYRTDLGERNYTNAPIKRYEALAAMGMFK